MCRAGLSLQKNIALLALTGVDTPIINLISVLTFLWPLMGMHRRVYVLKRRFNQCSLFSTVLGWECTDACTSGSVDLNGVCNFLTSEIFASDLQSNLSLNFI